MIDILNYSMQKRLEIELPLKTGNLATTENKRSFYFNTMLKNQKKIKYVLGNYRD